MDNVKHEISSVNRQGIKMTGICSVKQLDKDIVVVESAKGAIEIKGEFLLLNNFDVNTGEMFLGGNINSITYLEKYKF
jgi:sporulation protein YabP